MSKTAPLVATMALAVVLACAKMCRLAVAPFQAGAYAVQYVT